MAAKPTPHVPRPVASLAQSITAKATKGRVPSGSTASQLQKMASRPGSRKK